MRRLESLIMACLDHLGWNPIGLEIDPDTGNLCAELPARVGGAPCSVWLDAWEDEAAVVFTAYAPFKVRPDQIGQACVLLNELGRAIPWGSFRLDAEDGTVGYVATARFPESDACAPEGIWNLLRNGLGEWQRWFSALEQVATTGRSAQEILTADAAAHADPGTETPEDFVSYAAAAGRFQCAGEACA